MKILLGFNSLCEKSPRTGVINHEKAICASAVNPACRKGDSVGLSMGGGTTLGIQDFRNTEILWDQFLKDLRNDENKGCRKQVVAWRLWLLSETPGATSLPGLSFPITTSFTFIWQNTLYWKWEHHRGEERACPFAGRWLWTSYFPRESFFLQEHVLVMWLYDSAMV